MLSPVAAADSLTDPGTETKGGLFTSWEVFFALFVMFLVVGGSFVGEVSDNWLVHKRAKHQLEGRDRGCFGSPRYSVWGLGTAAKIRAVPLEKYMIYSGRVLSKWSSSKKKCSELKPQQERSMATDDDGIEIARRLRGNPSREYAKVWRPFWGENRTAGSRAVDAQILTNFAMLWDRESCKILRIWRQTTWGSE